ncbi:hypothetical protein J3L12_13170 [Meiothermus sp. CFH 77666]|nr:hypothetical protein [Meiothermus sp. CFH 77666]
MFIYLTASVRAELAVLLLQGTLGLGPASIQGGFTTFQEALPPLVLSLDRKRPVLW